MLPGFAEEETGRLREEGSRLGTLRRYQELHAAAANCVSEVTALPPLLTKSSFSCRNLKNMYFIAMLSHLSRGLANSPVYR